MGIQRAAPVNEFLAKLLFLLLPTAGIAYFLLDHLNTYFSILRNDAWGQTFDFAFGMFCAALVFSFLRHRFLPSFACLLIGHYFVYLGLDRNATGEFDTFFIAREFQIFATLLSSGWIMGWGFARIRYWSVGTAVLLLSGCIAIIAKSRMETVRELITAFAPALLFSVYIIFTAEQIYGYKDKSKKFWWFLTARLVGFLAIVVLLFAGVTYLMRDTLQQVVDNYGGQGKEGSNEMLKRNKDGTFNLKDYQKLRSSQGRSNELLFCAHIDNFFPGTTEPNPLYLTAFYFTKFDTSTETFERDSTIPYNDLFEPDPSKMQLFSTKADSSVLTNSLGDDYRKIVEIEIYAKSLSPETYLAPNAGFFVQPITIEKDFRQEFKSAFRAKSYVSELNSAYFVYNINKPEWRNFQEMRNNVLRRYTNYSKVDKAFMAYYTKMPSNPNFKKIADLAHSITDTAKTPVDKVLALRNYYLAKDANGDAVYEYTDNPGEPDIPNASKLMYFLFENHKGYCAYYAGATLFMLRAIGIPSRIAVGFLTENRADKNKGWYWYYAKQAHAWVQVYFPGLGWLDFDTTVGNSEAHESPTPDGTPPMQPPKAWLAADGVVEDVDTVRKLLQFSIRQFVFHDKDYRLPARLSLKMDVKVATIYRDSIALPLAQVQKGDEGTVVSYADAMKRIEPGSEESALAVVKRWPTPVPSDEVYLKRKDVSAPPKTEQVKPTATMADAKLLLIEIGAGALAILILLLSTGRLVLAYLKMRFRKAAKPGDKAYWAYMASCYYLHMVGVPRGSLTPLQYATRAVDPAFGTSFSRFMTLYLKCKYAKQPLTAAEAAFVEQFLAPFLATIGTATRRKEHLKGWLNPFRCVFFFTGVPNEEFEG